jgi:hypothetical protein
VTILKKAMELATRKAQYISQQIMVQRQKQVLNHTYITSQNIGERVAARQ